MEALALVERDVRDRAQSDEGGEYLAFPPGYWGRPAVCVIMGGHFRVKA